MATKPNIALRERAVLVTFCDSIWVASKVDKKTTAKTIADHEAKTGAGWFKGRLISKAALAPRWEVSHKARAYHNRTSSPWMNDGVRLLPATLLSEYMKQMRKFQSEAEGAETVFFKEYKDHIEEAKKLRGKLFNAEDYPAPDTLRGKFNFRVDVLPLPNVEDWRCPNMEEVDFAALKKSAEATLAQAQTAVLQDLYERLNGVVAHMRDRLKKSDAKFKNSIVGNIKEMVDLVAKLNITADPKLEALRKEIEQKLSKQDPDELREVQGKRDAVAKDADAILKKMASFMGPASKK